MGGEGLAALLDPRDLDGSEQTIRSIINPEKLAHLGAVADARRLLREGREQRMT